MLTKEGEAEEAFGHMPFLLNESGEFHRFLFLFLFLSLLDSAIVYSSVVLSFCSLHDSQV